MKQLLAIIVLVVFLAVPAYAGNGVHHKDPINIKPLDEKILGAKADFPNIIRLTKNSTIGIEGGKDLHDTNADEGWFAFAKFTWTGTWFDFSK